MNEGILGRKVGMTQYFDRQGEVRAATVIEAGPCLVIQVKTLENDGYEAVQLGFGHAKRLNSPQKGHLKKLGEFRYLREFRVGDVSQYKVGQRLGAELFQEGDLVHVIGISKGRGFAGVVKRHHFHGGRASHGSMFHRAPGSIGASAYPSRVVKGMRMAGHMGNQRVTVQNLRVAQIDPENNLLFVRGAVPGPAGAYVIVEKSGR